MSIRNVYICLIILGGIVINGCKKYDDTYKKFIELGVRDYAQKPDSLKVWSGRNRVKISWLILSDPSIARYKIYWDNKKNSLSGDIKRTTGIDTVAVVINNLNEGVHYFDIYMYDKYGNSSIGSEVIGNAYGEVYQGSLLQRVVKNLTYNYDQVEIEWSQGSSDLGFVELYYKDDNGDSVKLIMSADKETDTIRNLNMYNRFKYRSGYLPDSLNIDTFYTDYDTVEFDKELELDKSMWKILPLDNDITQPHWSSRDPSRMWDGSISVSPFAFEANQDGFPVSFTIDLGRKAFLTRFRKNDLYSEKNDNYLFHQSSPKIYEIWGSNDPGQDGD